MVNKEKVLNLIDAVIENRDINDILPEDDFKEASDVANAYEEALNDVEYFLLQAFLNADSYDDNPAEARKAIKDVIDLEKFGIIYNK